MYHVIDICGKIGLGDHIQVLSWILTRHKEDLFLRIHSDPNSIIDHNYIYSVLLSEFKLASNQKINYIVLHDWFEYNENRANRIFKDKTRNIDWYFAGGNDEQQYHQYTPFEKQWINNKSGIIALSLNHLGWIGSEDSLLGPKFFTSNTHFSLLSLHNSKYYYCLGSEYNSLSQEIDIIKNCRYILGIEGAWTHIAHCMNIPYISFLSKEFDVRAFHPNHPNLRLIDVKDMFEFLV